MKRIHRCVNARLLGLYHQILSLDQLNLILKSFLPTHLKEVCRATSFRKGQLFLFVSDQVYASELRYMLPELRDKFRKEGNLHQLISVQLGVEAAKPYKKIMPKIIKSLSSESKQTLLSASEAISDPNIKSILEKMANK